MKEEKYPFETVKITDEELWSLDTTIAKFILPRLKMFRQQTESIGMSWGCFSAESNSIQEGNAKTLAAIDSMIVAFEIASKDDFCTTDKKRMKLYNKGMKLFAKYFNNLWT